MDEKELSEGFIALNELAKSDYHRSLQDLMVDSADQLGSSLQIWRLIGVVLKEPFATPVRLKQPSPYTGAFRAWELDENRFADASRTTHALAISGPRGACGRRRILGRAQPGA